MEAAGLQVESTRAEKRCITEPMVPVTEENVNNPPGFPRSDIRSRSSSSSNSVIVHHLRRPSQAGWTENEDLELAKAVNRIPEKNWTEIAKSLPGRTYRQCATRWETVLNPELRKGHWTKEDDNLLMNLVEEHGAKNWSFIATFFKGRMGKQCRERWHNSLNPAMKRGGWTREEDCIIARYHAIFGNQWTRIASFLSGRNGDSVKNHWSSKIKSKGKRPRTSLEIVNNTNDNIEEGLRHVSYTPDAFDGSDKRLFINNISERSLIEDALFDRSSNKGIDEIRRRYEPFREHLPSDFSRCLLPHLRSTFDSTCSQPYGNHEVGNSSEQL